MRAGQTMARRYAERARGRAAAAALGAALLAAAGCMQQVAAPGPSEDELRDAIAVALSHAEGTAYRDTASVRGDSEAEPIEAYYRARDYGPLWVGPDGVGGRGLLLLDRLSHADRDALDPSSFAVEATRSAAMAGDSGGLASADILLSRSLVRYAAALRGSDVPDAGVLAAAPNDADFGAWLEALAPAEPAYHRLRAALAAYREIAVAGGWPIVPLGATLEEGDVDFRVTALRRRLAATGDLTGDEAGDPRVYDAAVAAAVARFQARHGLQPDGLAGAKTLAAMNRPVTYRVRQIETSLRSFRGPDFRIGERGILVNIAAAEVTLIEDGRAVLTSRAIVGRPDWPTPNLRSRITAIEFNPPWVVPKRIAQEEILPRIRDRGEAYLQRQGIRVLDGRNQEVDAATIDWAALNGKAIPYVFRQDPGPLNPLGRVKFLFANEYDVYLHDTPSRSLFVRSERTLSHGCIRVEAAEQMAFRLLSEEGWTEERFRAALARDKSQRVALKWPLPVHLVTLSAWVDEDGAVQFREDPYAPPEGIELATDGASCPADVEAIRNFKKTF